MLEEKDLEVISGTGQELDISPVYDHIKMDKHPNVNKDKEIVIPKVKKQEDNQKKDKEDEKNKENLNNNDENKNPPA